MADKTVTEREAVLRERTGYYAGYVDGVCAADPGAVISPSHIQERAAKRFPLPKVTRPRVVADSEGNAWRVVDGNLECRDAVNEWTRVRHCGITAERLRMWADLLANPTEEVEEEGV